MATTRPSVAVYKFSSCDGCQLSLLNMEDELLDLAGAVDLAFFLEASRATRPGPYDIALVEGSVTTEHEVERIKEIRAQATTLVALGTCSTAGGIQALRNFADAEAFARTAYPHPEFLKYLKTSKPMSAYVQVDLELWGCPVDKGQVLEVIGALLQGRKPNLPPYSVCLECKRSGAICPGMGRGCYGCFGPVGYANTEALSTVLQRVESQPGEALRLYRGISGGAAVFSNAATELSARVKESR